LLNYLTKLMNRLKRETMDQGIKMNQILRLGTKKRTLRGSISPH